MRPDVYRGLALAKLSNFWLMDVAIGMFARRTGNADAP